MFPQIVFDILAEDMEVDNFAVVLFLFRDPALFGKTLPFVGRTETDGVHVDIQRALDTAAAAFAHAAPVLERIADQGVWRNGGDGFIPILHLDGI